LGDKPKGTDVGNCHINPEEQKGGQSKLPYCVRVKFSGAPMARNTHSKQKDGYKGVKEVPIVHATWAFTL